jgi:uncharacterized membrane protein YfcA
MDIASALLVTGASIVAGGMNSIAGGGSIVSFPAALAAGLPPIVANATNCVAMTPGNVATGWAYRRELYADRRLASRLMLASAAGGLLGGVILLSTSQRAFEAVVPGLMLGATLLLFFNDAIVAEVRAPADERPRRMGLLALSQFAVGIYGGYFGAGQGIATLALFALLFPIDIRRMNAHKSAVAGAANGVAALYFIVEKQVAWPVAALMGGGAIVGGLVGGVLGRQAHPRVIRGVVTAIGLTLTAVLAYRWWR